mgnify:CR=1 FL=1
MKIGVIKEKKEGFLNMTIPTFTLRQLVEAGAHFGHHARRWNPQMAPYIYGKKDNVHIINLQKTTIIYSIFNSEFFYF